MPTLRLFFLGILIFSLPGSSPASPDDTMVITSSGPIQGKRLPAGSGEVVAFLGIPYAEPPLGTLRFQKPVPHQPWSHVLETTSFGNSCPQITLSGFPDAEIWNANTPRSEDCLFLNIWVPHPRPSSPAAVLVWIHGGGFLSGTASLLAFNGAFLSAAENVIVVSLNYRLGALGFLSLPPAAPGNMGLWDQQLALNWIKQNVAVLGGDVTRITIFGQSAGGASVGFHLLSPGSQPLFHRAVLQSGSPNAVWAWVNPEEAKRRARGLAQLMDCSRKDDSAVVSCLQERDVEEFQKDKFSLMDPNLLLDFPFVPTVDGDFLPDEPERLLKSRQFHAKPIMMGPTTDDGSATFLFGNPFLHTISNGTMTWEQLLDGLRMTVLNATEHLIQKVVLRYSHAASAEPAQYGSSLIQAAGDYWFVCPLTEVAKAMAEAGNPVYFYTFAHRSTGSPWPEWMGSTHSSEIPYLFGTLTSIKGTKETHTEAELSLIPRVMRYWAEFARAGNPTASSLDETKWPPFSPAELNSLRIGTEPPRIMEPALAQHCAFWKAMLSQKSESDKLQEDLFRQNKKQEL